MGKSDLQVGLEALLGGPLPANPDTADVTAGADENDIAALFAEDEPRSVGRRGWGLLCCCALWATIVA
jgi:hypothetical protein